MKLFKTTVSLILPVYMLLISNVILAQTVTIRRLDSLFKFLYTSGEFNGNVLVADRGTVIYKRSFGHADETTHEMLSDTSVFELASVSKQFTATAIAMLNEGGKLKYDDPVDTYIPELFIYHKVSIRNLLNHTCGLPDYMDLMDTVFDKHHIATNRDVIDILAKYQLPLKFEPGTSWAYSNTGYALLASIIESVSGQSYGDYLKQHIFSTIGMKHTFVLTRRLHPKKLENYAYGYVPDSLGKWVLPDDQPNTRLVVWLDGIVGDGCVNSTTVDLLLWDRALKTNMLINKKSSEQMFQATVLPNGKTINYGFGWGVKTSPVYGTIVDHNGAWPGYQTFIERDLTTDKTIIILQNHDSDSIHMPNREVRKIIYGISSPKLVVLPLSTLEKYAGQYQTDKGKIFKLIIKERKLFCNLVENPELEMHPVSATQFITTEDAPEVSFNFVSRGTQVQKLIMNYLETGLVTVAVKTNAQE